MKKHVIFRTNFFVCTIIILGFIITALISYHSNRGIFRQDVENITNLTVEGISHEIDSIFTKPINISLTMANDSLLKDFLVQEEERTGDEEFIDTMRNYLLSYKKKYNYDSIFLVSAKTNRYYHFNGLDRVLVEGDPENVWYYSFLETAPEYSLNIDNDEVANAHNEITVFINCKIKDAGGNIMGVVGVGFRINYLQKLFKNYEDKFGVKAYLINDEGLIEVSTEKTGYQGTDLFKDSRYRSLKEDILESGEKEENSFWYSGGSQSGYLITQYVQNLDWKLLIDYNTSVLDSRLNRQFALGVSVIVLVVLLVLFAITRIIRKYNAQIVQLTVEKEKEHRTAFQIETEKIYENIYEIDITHNCAASEETENYFVSLGAPRGTSYDRALHIIAKKQIKEEHREGYIKMFCPENVLKAYENNIDNLCYDFMITNDGGNTYYWMRITGRIFHWDDDNSVRMFAYRQNIDTEKKHEKKMYEKMEHDSLSELYNKASTQERISRILMENSHKIYAFFILDIDNFKSVNDTLGHAVGDLVIKDFATLLKSKFRADDIVGRIGGDEFVAFVDAPYVEWAEKKAEELSSVLHHEFVSEYGCCQITASIGVALVPEAGMDFESLYRNADTALYHTKENGRDGYTIYSGKQSK